MKRRKAKKKKLHRLAEGGIHEVGLRFAAVSWWFPH